MGFETLASCLFLTYHMQTKLDLWTSYANSFLSSPQNLDHLKSTLPLSDSHLTQQTYLVIIPSKSYSNPSVLCISNPTLRTSYHHLQLRLTNAPHLSNPSHRAWIFWKHKSGHILSQRLKPFNDLLFHLGLPLVISLLPLTCLTHSFCS